MIFASAIDANGIFDHLCIGTLGPTGILASCHVCLRLSSLFVMMSHSSWGTTTRRMVSEKWEKWFQKSSKTNSSIQFRSFPVSECQKSCCFHTGSIWRKGTDRGCNRLCQERQNLSSFSMCFILELLVPSGELT